MTPCPFLIFPRQNALIAHPLQRLSYICISVVRWICFSCFRSSYRVFTILARYLSHFLSFFSFRSSGSFLPLRLATYFDSAALNATLDASGSDAVSCHALYICFSPYGLMKWTDGVCSERLGWLHRVGFVDAVPSLRMQHLIGPSLAGI